MSQRHSLFAFLAVIIALVILSLIANEKNALDSQVFGNAIVGLIGIAGSFRPKSTQEPTQ